MTSRPRQFGRLLVRRIPALLTFVALLGLGYVGHRTHWRLPTLSALTGGGKDKDDWCMEHGVPESACVLCKEKVAAAYAPAQVPAAGAKSRVVQLATPDTARRAGIEVSPAEARAVVEAIEANAELGYDLTRFARVGSRATGQTAAVLVREGDRVAAGDVLALVEAADVGRAKAELLQAAVDIQARETTLARVRASVAGGFRNAADQQEAEAGLAQARIHLFNARQT